MEGGVYMGYLLDAEKFMEDYGIIPEPPADERDIIEEEEITWEQLFKK